MTPTDLLLSQLAALAAAVLTGLLIPAVVDVVTKSQLPAGWKAAMALILSAAAGAVSSTELAAGEHWQTYALAVVGAFITALATHLTGYTNRLQQATAGFGIGPRTPPDPGGPP